MAFLITKELIFGFQILDLKVHFSASLKLWRTRSVAEKVCNTPFEVFRPFSCCIRNIQLAIMHISCFEPSKNNARGTRKLCTI